MPGIKPINNLKVPDHNRVQISKEKSQDQIVADVDDILKESESIVSDVDSLLNDKGLSSKRKFSEFNTATVTELEVEDPGIITTLVDKKRPTVQCEECYECFEDNEKL